MALNFMRKLNLLLKRVSNLEDDNKRLNESFEGFVKILKNKDVYRAIGSPYTLERDHRIKLLIKAKEKGFFDDNKYFLSNFRSNSKDAFYKHHYSDIADNYRYDWPSDSLSIPAIGVKGNFSSGCVMIYQMDRWAEVFTNK